MCVCCECCVVSGRGLCDALASHPEWSYQKKKKKSLGCCNRARHVEIHVNSQYLGYNIQSRTPLSAGPSRVGYIPIL